MSARGITSAAVESLPLSAITIGERRRKKLGNLNSLARSLDEDGLLHPITVDMDGVLVAGHRRLEAARKLGWSRIPARRVKVDEALLRELELAENVERLDLDSYEQSKQRLREIQEAEAAAEADRVSARAAPKPPGRPKGGDREVARRSGLSRDEVRRTRQHVDAAERYDFLQKPEWKKSTAIAAGSLLDAIPERERNRAAAIIDQPGIPPVKAVEMLEKLGAKKPEERREIYQLSQSADPRDRSLAITKAAEAPPMPDPRIHDLDDVLLALKAAKKRFPSDDWVPRFKELIESTQQLRDELLQWSMSR